MAKYEMFSRKMQHRSKIALNILKKLAYFSEKTLDILSNLWYVCGYQKIKTKEEEYLTIIKKTIGKLVSVEPIGNNANNENWLWRKDFEGFIGLLYIRAHLENIVSLCTTMRVI